MEKAGLLDIALGPLKWLERARGRKRLALLWLYAAVLAVGGVLGWRSLSLWRLPNPGEPFDLARLGTVDLPDADNAMTYYREATRLIPAAPKNDPIAARDWKVTDWSAVDPIIRQFVADHILALDPFLRGADCRDSLLIQPRDLAVSSPLEPAFRLGEVVRLGILEASRREKSGDLEGAWRIYRAALRSSRHVGMHGGSMQRFCGLGLLRRAYPTVARWADLPGVTPAMLRRAIVDVEGCRAMTPPYSEAVRGDYFMTRQALGRPETWKNFETSGPEGEAVWLNDIQAAPGVRRFLRREPERSVRALNLIIAGQLAQCDRPRALRPRRVSQQFSIYERDAETPPAVRSVRPQDLVAWAEGSALSSIGVSNSLVLDRVDSEASVFDELAIKMAERAYEIDHGKPARTYADLLGPYLTALPDGIEPDSPTVAGSDPSPN